MSNPEFLPHEDHGDATAVFGADPFDDRGIAAYPFGKVAVTADSRPGAGKLQMLLAMVFETDSQGILGCGQLTDAPDGGIRVPHDLIGAHDDDHLSGAVDHRRHAVSARIGVYQLAVERHGIAADDVDVAGEDLPFELIPLFLSVYSVPGLVSFEGIDERIPSSFLNHSGLHMPHLFP